MNKSYDAIVIGTGQSGPFMAIRLAKAGRKVAIIERHRFGGTCVNTGCIPTKTLVASAPEAEVRKSGSKALMGKYMMASVGRAREKSETQGFMKVLVDASSKQILGAAVLGVGGDEAIHSLLDVMYAKAPYTVVSRAMHIHPTLSELIPTMLQDLKPL